MKKILLFILSISTLIASSSFLMPDEAFKPTASLNSKMQIKVKIEIAEDMYLYEDKVTLKLLKVDGITIKNIEAPISVLHHNDKVFLKSPSFLVDLKKDDSVTGMKKVTLLLSYQGCSDKGLCYEPLSKKFILDVDSSYIGSKKYVKEKEVTKELSQTDTIASTIRSGNIAVILATFFGFGLLLALTPCVFPMIPIISGLIISQGKNITTRKAFTLSAIYVLSMAIAYTIAGVLAGLFGENLQVALQTPWVVFSFSAIFVVLAMSMFGFYELKLPDSIVNRVSSANHSSGYIGVAIMGFLSALIVGPCVAAPLAGALVYIGQTGDAFLGGMALFAMSIGMGVPLILVGVSAGRFMPKPGVWMTMVNSLFGVMMLGVAIWMLEKVVDSYVTMMLYAMLGISFSLYLGVFEKDNHIFKKSVAMILFIYSVSLFIGTLGGSTSMSKPLSFCNTSVSTTSDNLQLVGNKFIKITSLSELDKLLEQNRGKKIMLDFYADWCVSCKEFEEVTFVDKDVQKKMKEFVLIQADVTLNGENEKALSQKYGIFGPPAIVFFDKNLKPIKSKRVIGFVKPKEFLLHLNTL